MGGNSDSETNSASLYNLGLGSMALSVGSGTGLVRSGLFGTRSAWPDLLVAAVLGSLALWGLLPC